MKTQWEYDLVEKPFCEQLKGGRTADLEMSNLSGGVMGARFLLIQDLLASHGEFPQMGEGCYLRCRLLEISEAGGDMLMESPESFL